MEKTIRKRIENQNIRKNKVERKCLNRLKTGTKTVKKIKKIKTKKIQKRTIRKKTKKIKKN